MARIESMIKVLVTKKPSGIKEWKKSQKRHAVEYQYWENCSILVLNPKKWVKILNIAGCTKNFVVNCI